jgi:hypothetical protein
MSAGDWVVVVSDCVVVVCSLATIVLLAYAFHIQRARRRDAAARVARLAALMGEAWRSAGG